MPQPAFVWPPILLLMLSVTAGCSSSELTTQTAQLTYAPALSYLSAEDDVQPAMKRMSNAILELHKVLAGESIDEPARERVFACLEELESAAATLERPGMTNHPKLDRNLDTFLADVELAKRAARATPPNYYLAGNISGSCMYCHSSEAPDDFRNASFRR